LPGEFTKAKQGGVQQEQGVLLGNDTGLGVEFVKMYIDAVAKHRVWDREVEHIAA
jgi:catalase